MNLSEKLYECRKNKGWSQEELADKLDVSRQTISKWESGKAVPELDKLIKLSELYNVKVDDLVKENIELDINNINNNSEEDEINEKVKKKNHKGRNIIFKIIITIILIYLIFCLYKFIVLFRFYKIADSFSEENYWMSHTWELDGEPDMYVYTKKVGSKIIIETSNPYAGENTLLNENGEVISYDIEYIDQEKEIAYKLIYDEESKMYTFWNRRRDATTEEEFKNILGVDENLIKEQTLNLIPSNFKSILLASINPVYQVSLTRREIYINNFNRLKVRILLTKDCLVESYNLQTEFDGSVSLRFSYDYVQDHFDDTDIYDPLVVYKDKIENYSEIDINK